ncbi:hypothetical protein CW304_33080, partial [Bacillus sp. UFRGS-B20]
MLHQAHRDLSGSNAHFCPCNLCCARSSTITARPGKNAFCASRERNGFAVLAYTPGFFPPVFATQAITPTDRLMPIAILIDQRVNGNTVLFFGCTHKIAAGSHPI